MCYNTIINDEKRHKRVALQESKLPFYSQQIPNNLISIYSLFKLAMPVTGQISQYLDRSDDHMRGFCSDSLGFLGSD